MVKLKLNDVVSRALLAVFALGLLSTAGAGEHASARRGQKQVSECPVVRLACPASVDEGNRTVFEARITGGDSRVTPTFNWSVSAGRIQAGQGTSRIETSAPGQADGDTVTATVEVGGFDRSCSSTASCTAFVMRRPKPRKVDEYDNLPSKEENIRLDKYVIELQTEPRAQGYIIAYGGRTSRAGEAQKAADKARNYIVKKNGIEASRVVTVVTGYREQLTVELWIVPPGAPPPKPTPTVDRNEVKPPPTKPTSGMRHPSPADI
jgi:hypothetical protein